MQTINLYNDIEFGSKRPSIKVLFESEFTKEIRILLAKGQEMKEHKTPFPIVIEIVNGEIDFGVQGEKVLANKGTLISLEGGIPHNLFATEDAIVRLTLSKNDSLKRVKKVITE